MKKIFAAALLILFALNIQAQWYSRQYGVNDINDLSEKQLKFALQKAETNVKTGQILTYGGLGVGAIGFVVAAHGTTSLITESWDNAENNLNEFAAGSALMLVGMGALAVGIPYWVIGASRRNKIEIALLNFNSSSYLGYNKPVTMGYKQPSTIGLRMKLSF